MSSRRILLLLLIPLAVFATNLDGTWVVDDHGQVEQNPFIRSVRHIPRIFSTRVGESSFGGNRGTDIYRPIFMSSYLLDYQIFGLKAAGFHFTNNVLHAINCVLLFLLVVQFVPAGFAWFAALLFALHPIVVEGVSWIGGRMDLLLGLFALLHTHLALRLVDRLRPSFGLWALYAASIPFGLFSKEPFVLVPLAVLGAFIISDTGGRTGRGRVGIMAGVVGVVTALCLLLRHRIVGPSELILWTPDNLKNLVALCRRFTHLLVNPADSDYLMGYPYVPFQWSYDLASFVFLSALIGLGVWRWRKNRGFLIGIGLFLSPLVPVTVAIVPQGLLSERYFYLPMAGFALAFVSILSQWVPFRNGLGRPRYLRLVLALTGIWLGALAVATIARNRDWHDEVRLFKRSACRDPSSHLPYLFLAFHYLRTGETDLEIKNYEATLQRDPLSPRVLNNLGIRYVERKRFDEAERILLRAYKVQPGRAKPSYNMGYLAESRGDRRGAAEWYARALKLDPGYALAKSAWERVSGRK